MRMMKLTSLVGISLGLGLLSGCASIVDGTHQSISVKTIPMGDADCSLKNNKGIWFIRRTPGSVVVHKSYDNLHVRCTKPGYDPANVAIKSHTKGMTFGNIIFGGAIGAGVDVGDGAAYNYPPLITVPMKKK